MLQFQIYKYCADLNGNERRYDEDGIGCLVSNGILHDELLKIIQTGKL